MSPPEHAPGIDQTEKSGRLRFIYSDLGARLANDNRNSWQMVSLAPVLMTFLAGLLALSRDLSLSAKIWAALGCFFLFLTVLLATISVLVPRDLPRLRLKRFLLGQDGQKGWANNDEILKRPLAHSSVFHTRVFLRRGYSPEARRKYLEDVETDFDEDLVDYLFFLADLIEVKRRPRVLAMRCLFLGAVCIVGLLVMLMI